MLEAPTGAEFSDDRTYRYLLWRRWGGGTRFVHLNGLNPSTADETKDDPTIRREIAFAKSWGADGLFKTNAYGFRATDPRDMLAAADPIGPENDHWIKAAHAVCEFSVACWGVNIHAQRQSELRRLINWRCLGLTKAGFPKHPLYLKASTPLVAWA